MKIYGGFEIEGFEWEDDLDDGGLEIEPDDEDFELEE